MTVGLASLPALAGEPTLADDFLPTRLAGYVYINAATGDRTVTRPTGSRLGDLFWQNDDMAGSCNFFYGQDRPTRDTVATGRVKFGSAVVTWGDLSAGSLVDGYEAAYSTDIHIDCWEPGPVPGLDMVNVFMNAYDGVADPGGTQATLIRALVIENLDGECRTDPPPFFIGWIYAVDLEGSGLEFTVGDEDLDGDGLADFAYSYEFVQGQTEAPKGIIGPMLVRPASLGGLGTAMGCPDLHDWYNQTSGGSTSFSDYVGSFWFGGGDCAVPRPYSSFFMNLYGVSGDALCAAIDFTADGVIDFADYLEFLNVFDSQDPLADLNEDGLVDFTDYLEFLNRFDACAS